MEDDPQKKKDTLLLEQDYGDEDAWKAHFEYLLPFFEDERYIRMNGKPVFAIYYISYIEKSREMFALWDRLAKENGFPGLQILSVNENIQGNEYVNGIIHYGYGQLVFATELKIRNKIKGAAKKLNRLLGGSGNTRQILDYDRYWSYILRDRPYGNVQNYPGGTVRYDETPRRGNKSFCLKNESPELLQKNLTAQLERGRELFGTEYLFLDAWNEWGEGNYLEPDTDTEYQYLEAVKAAIDGAKNSD